MPLDVEEIKATIRSLANLVLSDLRDPSAAKTEDEDLAVEEGPMITTQLKGGNHWSLFTPGAVIINDDIDAQIGGLFFNDPDILEVTIKRDGYDWKVQVYQRIERD